MFKFKSVLFIFVFLTFSLQGVNYQHVDNEEGSSAANDILNFARGNQEFKDLHFKQHEREFVRMVHEGQSPRTLFIGCSDSRIVPDLILGTRPGDLFVIRTAGNFVPSYNAEGGDAVGGTLQYAVEVLNVRHIVVCGHNHCGAIKGLYQNLDENRFGLVKRWLRNGEEAKQLTMQTVGPNLSKEELYRATEEISILYQLKHLLTYPFVKKRVQEGTLDLHGWYNNIETGEVEYYDINANKFVPLRNLVRR